MAHVLVVDDDEATREALRWLLTDEGHDVTEAPDGRAALEMLRQATARWVVLFDYRMPGLDGQGLLSAVAADPRLRHQHAYIAMTASPHVLDLVLGQQREALGVPLLPKPLDLDTLMVTIAQAEGRLSLSE
jgi:two-component system nitrogen regulation response regulator NtrX